MATSASTASSTAKTYFISDGQHVKIGRSCKPSRRAAGLQTASAQPLKTILILDGDFEHELHELFKVHRIRGEWFHLCDEISKFVARGNGERWVQPFYSWLLDQRAIRQDDVSKLAFEVAKDRTFPKRSRKLYALLGYYERKPHARRVLKRAHREWRRTVRAMNTTISCGGSQGAE